MNLIEKNIDQIRMLCNKHKVATLFVFGSVLTEYFNADSDLDFMVDFDNIDIYDYADNYFDLKFSLEELFNRKVDLLENKAINNPFLRNSIDSTKMLIHG